jgi:hypothetical protein
MELGEAQCFRQDYEGVLWFKDHLVVPKNFEIHRKIMDGALLEILYPPQNPQNVSRLEEEFLVDKNEEGNHKICVRV